MKQVLQTSQLPPEQLLSAIVAGSDDAIISKDLNGIIMSWNDAAQRIFGYNPAEALGRPITILIPAERLQEENTILARLRAGERIDHFETVRVTKDGRRLDVSLTISPVRDSTGAIIGASKIARDITADKAARRALAQANEQLKDHSNRLETAVAARTAELRDSLDELETFSSGIAHDVKGPLRAICAYAELLRVEHRGVLSPPARELLDNLVCSCNRLQRFVENILAYARTRHAPLRLQTVDLAAIITKVLEEYPHAKQANAEVRIVQPLLPVKGDEPLLIQVLANLVSNAVKFVAAGTRPVVDIWTERRGSDVRLCIKDNGIGIHESDREKIFGLFTRLHTDSHYEGTGVGLAVVARALLKMGGSTGVESEPGKGSVFWIQLKSAEQET